MYMYIFILMYTISIYIYIHIHIYIYIYVYLHVSRLYVDIQMFSMGDHSMSWSSDSTAGPGTGSKQNGISLLRQTSDLWMFIISSKRDVMQNVALLGSTVRIVIPVHIDHYSHCIYHHLFIHTILLQYDTLVVLCNSHSYSISKKYNPAISSWLMVVVLGALIFHVHPARRRTTRA